MKKGFFQITNVENNIFFKKEFKSTWDLMSPGNNLTDFVISNMEKCAQIMYKIERHFIQDK